MIPSDLEKRKKLVTYIKNIAEEKFIADSASLHISAMKKDIKDQFDIPAKEINHYVKSFMDEGYIVGLEQEVDDVVNNYKLLKALDV